MATLLERINALTDEQAVWALQELWDLLPWEKPTAGVLVDYLNEIEWSASERERDFVRAIRENRDPEVAAALARTVLSELAKDENMHHHLDEAIRRAQMPHMASGVEVALVLVMAALTSRIKFRRTPQGEVVFEYQTNLPELIKSLAELADKLPQSILEKLRQKFLGS
jgi:hypothetical protein